MARTRRAPPRADWRNSGLEVTAKTERKADTKALGLLLDLKNLPGQELLIFASTWQPGFRLPLHIHPDGHEVTYVVEGEQTFEVAGVGASIVVKAGEALYTPPNTPHFGRNATDRVSKTIVVRIKDKDKPISMEVTR